MKFEKNDIIALIGSIIFHLSILLVLYFTVLKTIVPEEDSGIMVNFGNVNLAAGQFEPRGEPASSDMTAAPPPQPAHPTPREEMITQDLEESVSLTNKKKEQERKKKEKKEQEEARRKRRFCSLRYAINCSNLTIMLKCTKLTMNQFSVCILPKTKRVQ